MTSHSRHTILALLLVAAVAAPVATNVAAALGFGLVTSLVSGLYPAWKAANERPVDALRK